jgi:23S rRNA pseudouridine1911/1915/1917 synthase
LARVRIETGRTHQIRVHMASISHPVVGDTLYGAPARIIALPLSTTRKAAREVLELDRNFLHSSELEFAHPITGKLIQLQSALPPELAVFLEKLRNPVDELESSGVANTISERLSEESRED